MRHVSVTLIAVVTMASACAFDDDEQRNGDEDLGTVVQASTCSCALGVCVCGEIWNSSPLWILISGGNQDTEKGWCWDNDNAPRYGANLPCQTFNSVKSLPANTESDNGYFTDTDSFRADHGCVTKFWNNSPIETEWMYPFSERIEDRRGKSLDKWIKIYDNDAIQITYQSCDGTLPKKYWVDTFATAYGYQDEYCLGDGSSSNQRCNRDGELFPGTNYVFCKRLGDTVDFGDGHNHWWLLTDLDKVYDGRDGRSFISAYYLTHWGNDVAKDNNGVDIPDC